MDPVTQPVTLLVGFIAFGEWVLIWRHSSRGPLGWAAPTSLFALGLLLLYITPSVYWMFRPWNVTYPPYYDGLPLVLAGAVLLGLPFLLDVFLRRRKRGTHLARVFQHNEGEFGPRLWLCVIPILAGVAYRIYLFTLGYQSRNVRDVPMLFGSDSLALLVGNISDYFPVFYFALVALGNRLQRRIGLLSWALDALLQLMSLARFDMLYFVFRSAIFMTLRGWRLSRKQWAIVALFSMFVIAIVGRVPSLAKDLVSTGEAKYLTPGQVVMVVIDTTRGFLSGELSGGTSPLLQALDDTFERLHMARSASAVMMNVPDVIPYEHGKTFLHVLYAWIPRYLWASKPNIRAVNLLTTLVMPDDSGLNPTGTIAELYVNYGFIAVFLGGIGCAYLCRAQERILLRKGRFLSPTWLCVYPSIGLWYFWADANLSQRLTEGLHVLLLFALVWLFLGFARRRSRRATQMAIETPIALSP